MPTVRSIAASRYAKIGRLHTVMRSAKYNNPIDNPVASSPPTIAQSASTDGTLTQVIPAVSGGLANTAKLTLLGGLPTPIGTFLVFPCTDETPLTGNLNGYGGGATIDKQSQVSWCCEFEFWGTKAEFEFSNSASAAGFKLQVNGAYVSKTATALVANQKYLSIDFGSLGWRHVRLECQAVLTAVRIAATDELRPTDLSDVFRSIWVGNSYFRDGFGANSSVDHTAIVPFVASTLLGFRDTRPVAIGATGYLLDAGRSTYRGRVASALALNPNADMVVISDPANDYANGQTTAAITAEAMLCWQAYRAAYPNALIVVTGMQPRVSGPSAPVIAVENALKAQFDIWADPFSVWVPISTDATPWVTTANASLLIATDNVHLKSPPTGGSLGLADAQIGRRMADSIRSAVDTLRRNLA